MSISLNNGLLNAKKKMIMVKMDVTEETHTLPWNSIKKKVLLNSKTLDILTTLPIDTAGALVINKEELTDLTGNLVVLTCIPKMTPKLSLKN